MIAILTLLAIAGLSLIVGRVATVALTVTGMSRESARFQARSALTGAGFTTTESESIVNHPIRRKIIMNLMLVGSLGIVASAGTLIAGLAGAQTAQETGFRLLLLVLGLFALVRASRSRWVDQRLSGAVGWMVHRLTGIQIRDYHRMLHLAGDYAVGEVPVEQGDWMAGRTLGSLGLRAEGVVVLGITRSGGDYLGTPVDATLLEAGDILLCYGRAEALARLDERRPGRAGEQARAKARRQHRRVVETEQHRERSRRDQQGDHPQEGDPA